MLRKAIAIVLLLSAQVLAFGQTERSIDNFAFVQVSDIHVSPHVARTGAPGPLRGAESVAWICKQAVGPQTMVPFGITTPAPALALATGDLTEYGVIDDTWSLFEQAFASLPYPLYVLPGNHDNTWVAMYHIMRERYGGENYSFDKFGCHFACICSASPQEPVPSIDATTRTWLKRDLESILPDTPVFVALHHPPYSTEFAPAEYDTFIDLLRDYNVVLLLYGHGHGVSHRNLDGIDGVMGGSTFGNNAGYAVISVQDGMLRVAYHYYRKPPDGNKPSTGPGWRKVFKKPLERRATERLFRTGTPPPGALITDDYLDVSLDLPADDWRTEFPDVKIYVDGQETEARLEDTSQPAWRVDVSALKPGAHLVTVRATQRDGRSDLRTTTFVRRDDDVDRLWQTVFPAAVKAGPVVADDKIIVACTDGVVTALERSSGRELWSFTTGGEILGTPAYSRGVVVFGSGDGKVYALDDSGKDLWTFDAGLPVYGAPLIEGEAAYIGDNGGRMHALDLKTGAERWTFSRADYSIECKPCLWDDLVVFGAWDGYLYALRQSDGKLQCKVLGPKASDGKASQYYAPADCGPATVGDTLFVCDRGYFLGTFDRAGSQGQRVDEGISGI
ncbi:MAG: PQQ-binding-like beta-propeller repeat protein, partial [Planctomycetes bacterium]|nr:PQQ-binding-like beta-propeller repeat protein [Planctomycetota bacterium]